MFARDSSHTPTHSHSHTHTNESFTDQWCGVEREKAESEKAVAHLHNPIPTHTHDSFTNL